MRNIVIGQQVVDWVASRTNSDYGKAVGFGIDRDGQLIAGVVFNDYNGVNIDMHVASDGSKRWMTKELLWMVFDYAFNQAKVNRITGLVAATNVAARRFDEHIGFTLEATLKGAHPEGDLLVYVLWREQCRWLNWSRHEYLKAA